MVPHGGRYYSPFFHSCPPAGPSTPPGCSLRPSNWPPRPLASLSDLLANLLTLHMASDPQADPLAGFQTISSLSWLLRPSIRLLRPSSWPLRPSGRPLNLPAGLSDPLAGLQLPQTRSLTSQIQNSFYKSSANDPLLGRDGQFWALWGPPQPHMDLKVAKHSKNTC